MTNSSQVTIHSVMSYQMGSLTDQKVILLIVRICLSRTILENDCFYSREDSNADHHTLTDLVRTMISSILPSWPLVEIMSKDQTKNSQRWSGSELFPKFQTSLLCFSLPAKTFVSWVIVIFLPLTLTKEK